MKSIHNDNGGLHLRFEPHEAEFLLGLSDKIAEALKKPGNRRLLPACAEDPDLNRELCEWLHPELQAARADRVLSFQEELRKTLQADGALRLDEEAMLRWLGVLNDLRLIFAGELGIDDDTWPQRLTPEQLESPPVRIYHYLSGLQGALLEEGFHIHVNPPPQQPENGPSP